MDGRTSSSARSGAPQNIPVPSSSRIRNPPPPSPLSQISSPTSDAGISSKKGTSSLAPPASIPEPLTSPCYIHSYLDKHGSGTLGDYLNHQGHHGSGVPGHGHGHGHGSKHEHQQQQARRVQGSMPNGLGAALDAMNLGEAAGVSGEMSGQPGASGRASGTGSSSGQASTPISRDHSVKYSARHSPRIQHHQTVSTNDAGAHSSPTHTTGRLEGGESRQGSVSGGSDYGGSERSAVNGVGSGVLDGGDFDEDGGSLTKQLAETAQGVREMSRELGRTVVKSRIQSVLIVTKARDNRLIKLTRELAVYLMSKRSSSPTSERPGSAASTASTATASGMNNYSNSNTDRGLIVYVDAQLRKSKRFNAAGIKEEHPEFFRPTVRRRSSSSTSVSTLSAAASSTSLGDLHRKRSVMGGGHGDDGQLRYWTGEMCSSQPHLFDFVITLGGDGTVLFTSWLFQKIVPPVLPFALGSLGFLTNFDFANYRPTMDRVIDEGIRVNLRMRFTCTVYRAVAPEEADCASLGVCGGGGGGSGSGSGGGKGRRKAIKKPGGEILMSQVDKAGWEALEGGPSRLKQTRKARSRRASTTSGDGEGDEDGTEADNERDKEIMCFTTRPVEQFEVLNDLVVDRGPSPYVSLLEIFGDEHHLTTVQADGLTVSTPTGSTAYSLSAGGSLVHPQIPAILLTPICPHTLSFRPMLLPDGMELRICVPYNSRSTAWASFDGRGRVELKQGDHIKVTASKYPFPTVSADKASTDWFSSVSRTLRWNEREKQKSFVVVEEDAESPNHREVIDSGKPERREERVADGGDDGTSNGQSPNDSSTQGKDVEEAKQRNGQQPRQPDMSGERRQKSKEKAEAGMDDPKGKEAQRDVEREEEEEDEEDEEFDIDDKSGEATPSSPGSPDQTPKHGQSYEPASYLSAKPHASASAAASASSRPHADAAQSGVNTPDRFVTHHSGPPPLSQRHLIDKLQQAQTQQRKNDAEFELELSEKEGERGQRDEIRENPGAMRVQGMNVGMLPAAQSASASHSASASASGAGSGTGSRGRGAASQQQQQQQQERHQSHHHTSNHREQQRPSSRRATSDMSYTSSSRRTQSTGRHEGRAKAFAFFGQDDSASDMSDDLAEM